MRFYLFIYLKRLNNILNVWDSDVFDGQVYVKFSALFRVSRKPFPYEDTSHLLSQVVASYGANRVMWGRYLYRVLNPWRYLYFVNSG